MKELKNSYTWLGTEIRPVINTSLPLRVDLGVSLVHIEKLAESEGGGYGDITLSVWLVYMWKDEILMWAPEEYGGVSRIHMPIQYIWKPDIVLFNGIGASMVADEGALSIVDSDGSVFWSMTSKLNVRCEGHYDDSWWGASPEYDYTCKFTFASWTYDGFKLDINLSYEGMDLANFSVDKGGWLVVNNTAAKNVYYYPCCAEPYQDLTFKLNVKKNIE